MSKLFRVIFALTAVFFLLFASFMSLANTGQASVNAPKNVQKKLNQLDPQGEVIGQTQGVNKITSDINSLPLVDNQDLYQYDDEGSVVTMYVTVRRGNDLENTNHSWREVNDATKFFTESFNYVVIPKAEVILQIGNENGPLPGQLGYDAVVPNATITVRGNSTSMSPQKSYKIMLFNNTGEWRGQSTINLSKSVFDPTRLRNKLAFDLMKEIPNMVSLRTQFVHLYVNDQTSDPSSEDFEDYGLFTQIEMPNKKFLKNHLLDRYGHLYKAIMFEFQRYPEKIREADDPLYDEKAFESVLEIQGARDHTKLIEMLDAVNNYTIPIQETFDSYFDEDNYFSWMAFNIISENVDTNSQNFYLYSPQNGQKWYFIPWDYDGGFNRQLDVDKDIQPYQQGVSTYWAVVLHQRILMVPEYREKLDQKILELMEFMTPEKLQSLLVEYKPIVFTYINRMPDILHYPWTVDYFEAAVDMIPMEPKVNYDLYIQSLKQPMPFYLGTPEIRGEKVRFTWDEAYDYKAEDITYQFELSDNWDFKENLFKAKLINVNHFEIPKLPTGVYYWRVQATNESGLTQFAFDFYTDSDDVHHYGIKYLYISPTGEILEK